jgi:adenylate cyclase
MVLQISGPVALAKKAGESSSDLADLVAQILQEEAAEHGVPYLKFVAQQAIAAAGLESDDDTAMTRVATLAVTVRERCSGLFDAAGPEAEFHIGLGFGVAFGCGIGQEPRQFNLWGEAVQTADIMAASAGPGSIQASEAAYARLRQDFLFRPRGSFYMPGIGEARTFVLAGQL